MKLDEFTRAYVTCALWSSTDESRDDGGDPLDANYSIEDIDDRTLAEMARDCAAFQEAEKVLLAQAYVARKTYDAASAGHDFWLTRNRHGAGFWDRGLGDVGERLTSACKPYGSYDLYVGDDGKVHA